MEPLDRSTLWPHGERGEVGEFYYQRFGSLWLDGKGMDSVKVLAYSPDGHFEPGAVGTAYAVLRVFDPAVAAASFDLTKTYNDTFVKQAISGR